ncbi:hypothetical protein J5X98_01035 [Leptothermofonsia sichuanensis E412]|jgi:hypothetical protein|uniref:ribbon-helix-helix domain-containing protein n=1 Tax=Leptothermofonsia sichuanensis TaxID=2917832 RepID=UPI001CA78DAC|nr:hypothetical protein [Leptothermofonsia sichuanensis]QZZ21127.1 hypothetical protein J5X98_01035 [Leptothermofonsia sichuanensis E412]
MPKKIIDGKVRISPSITLNQEIFDYLELWAEEDDRSLSGQIAYIIRREVKEKYGAIETKVKISHRRARTVPAPQPEETRPRRAKKTGSRQT